MDSYRIKSFQCFCVFSDEQKAFGSIFMESTASSKVVRLHFGEVRETDVVLKMCYKAVLKIRVIQKKKKMNIRH